MKLSRFCKVVNLDENLNAVFNSLIMDVFYLSDNEVENLLKLNISPSDLKEYKESGIVTSDEEQDETALKVVKNRYDHHCKKIAVMYLIMSSGCNLGCTYCFIENNTCNNKNEINMTPEVVKTAVQKYCDYVKQENIVDPLIIFYGGEPTVNWNMIEEAINVAKGNKSNIKFSIVTNGTLLTEERIKYLVENKVDIGISIDGPKQLNDKNRVYRSSNKSVFDRVTKTVRLLQKHNAKFGLSITVSEDIIENQDEVLEWIKQYGVYDIFYNLYHYTSKADWKSYYEKACKFLYKSHEILSECQIYDGRLQRKIDSFTKEEFKFGDCAAIGGNQITIKPNGEVCVCQGYLKTDKFVFANILKDELKDITKTSEFDFWANRATLCKRECLDCEALYICGSGCVMQAEALFGNRDELDLPFCMHSKDSLKWLLLKSYNIALEDK